MNFLDTINAFTLSKCLALITHVDRINSGVAQNLAFAAGDHWHNAQNPVAKLVPADIAQRPLVLANIYNDFTPLPLIEEVVQRAVFGLVGREPAFQMTLKRALAEDEEPTPEEQADIEMADAAMGAWWDQRDMHEHVQKLTHYLLVTEAAYLNPVLPDELLEPLNTGESGIVATSLEDAMNKLYVEAMSPEAAYVYTHPGSRRQVGMVAYQVETEEGGSVKTVQKIRLTFVNDNGLTVIRTLGENGVEGDDVEVDAGGELLMAEALGKPFLTEPVRRMQHTINMLNTMLPRNAKYAGFRGRHTIGIKPPKDAAGDLARPNLGASTFNQWQAVEYQKEDGSKGITPAQLVFEEPVDSAPLRADIAHLVRSLLRAVDQLHTEMSDDATASAVSRIQARAAFAMFLMALRPAIEGALRSFLYGLLILSAHLAGDAALAMRLKALRVSVNIKPYTGPLAPDEISMVILLMEKGLISREMAMVMTGIEDIDAERAKISGQEPDWAQVTAKVQAFSSAGLPSEFIWQEVLELDPEQMQRARAAMGMQTPRLTGNPTGTPTGAAPNGTA
jgi:hypothetical protein